MRTPLRVLLLLFWILPGWVDADARMDSRAQERIPNADSDSHPVTVIAVFGSYSSPLSTDAPPLPLSPDQVEMLLQSGVTTLAFAGSAQQALRLFPDPGIAERFSWIPVFPHRFITDPLISPSQGIARDEDADSTATHATELDLGLAEFINSWVQSGQARRGWILFSFPDLTRPTVVSWMVATTEAMRAEGWIDEQESVYLLSPGTENLENAFRSGQTVYALQNVDDALADESHSSFTGCGPSPIWDRSPVTRPSGGMGRGCPAWLTSYPASRQQMGELALHFESLSTHPGSLVFLEGNGLVEALQSNSATVQAYASLGASGVALFPLPQIAMQEQGRPDGWNVVKVLILVGFLWILRGETYYGQRFYRYFANFTFLDFEILDRRIRSNLGSWVSILLTAGFIGLLGSQWMMARFGGLGMQALAAAAPRLSAGLPPQADAFLLWFVIAFFLQVVFTTGVWLTGLRHISFQQALILYQWPTPLLSIWMALSVLFGAQALTTQMASFFLFGAILLLHHVYISSQVNVAKVKKRREWIGFILGVGGYALLLGILTFIVTQSPFWQYWLPFAMRFGG